MKTAEFLSEKGEDERGWGKKSDWETWRMKMMRGEKVGKMREENVKGQKVRKR